MDRASECAREQKTWRKDWGEGREEEKDAEREVGREARGGTVVDETEDEVDQNPRTQVGNRPAWFVSHPQCGAHSSQPWDTASEEAGPQGEGRREGGGGEPPDPWPKMPASTGQPYLEGHVTE